MNKEQIRQQKIKDFRKEASRLASMANKRIARLEKAGLIDSPAYKKFQRDGATKFGIRGKDYNQVQQEVARMNSFLNNKTSTIKGVENTLKTLADNTGITYNTLDDIKAQSGKFFELANKVEQYLRLVEDRASAVDYHKIWEAINTFTQDNEIDLTNNVSVDNYITEIVKIIDQETEEIPTFDFTGWQQLPTN